MNFKSKQESLRLRSFTDKAFVNKTLGGYFLPKESVDKIITSSSLITPEEK